MQNIKWIIALLVIIILLLFTFHYSVLESTTTTTMEYRESDHIPLGIINQIVNQRNLLSQQLNEARKTIGQLQCEKSDQKTNSQGGWCKQASTETGGEHMTDMTLVKALAYFLKNKSIGSFGDGPGAYKREILKLGLVQSYTSFDGAPYCEETSEGRVVFMDLTIPQYGIQQFDWILSLEVAEHIPKAYENIYLDNLFRHAKEGIILSWAVPGQGGLSHINNQPLQHVVDVMEKNGFTIDQSISKVLQDSAELPWIKSNLYVYRRHQHSMNSTYKDLFV
ncbi:uncharacterized protein [Mytilus edulis]|uniref:uncharacterized protein n=1 Tax=Mytilus edulis TaxID=6550 RepID=UPI0039F14337